MKPDNNSQWAQTGLLALTFVLFCVGAYRFLDGTPPGSEFSLMLLWQNMVLPCITLVAYIVVFFVDGAMPVLMEYADLNFFLFVGAVASAGVFGVAAICCEGDRRASLTSFASACGGYALGLKTPQNLRKPSALKKAK